MADITLEVLNDRLQRLIDDIAAVKDEQAVHGRLMWTMQGSLHGISGKIDRLDGRVRRFDEEEEH